MSDDWQVRRGAELMDLLHRLSIYGAVSITFNRIDGQRTDEDIEAYLKSKDDKYGRPTNPTVRRLPIIGTGQIYGIKLLMETSDGV